MPNGRMRLTRSLTSGLTRRAGDPPGVFWGVGDRGPNITPGAAVNRYGLASLEPLEAIDGARVLALPECGPCLARFRLVDRDVHLEGVFALHAPDGQVLVGLSPPAMPGTEHEPVFAIDGTRLPNAENGADTEGIAARPDGRFWIADEYGPSLLLVSDNGLVEKWIVPAGPVQPAKMASVATAATLPSLAAARKLNRGFEGIAVTPDGQSLFVAFQSPLAHPDRAAHDEGDIVRIWKLNADSGAFGSQFGYPLDPSSSFLRDCEDGPVNRNDVKVSELTCLADGSLLVLERVTLSTHIYRIWPDAAHALPPGHLDPAHRPTLEQIGQAAARAAGIRLLDKTLVLSTDVQSEICGDLEGMLVLDDGSLLLANDNDYGIEGAVTQFWRVCLPERVEGKP